MPKWRTNISVPENLRAEFDKARRENKTFDSFTEFVSACMAAYVTQTRRGAKLCYPIQFQEEPSRIDDAQGSA